MHCTQTIRGPLSVLTLLACVMANGEEDLPAPMLAPPLLEASEATHASEPPEPTPATGAEAPEPETESFLLPHDQHPWARFAPGAWRRTRATTEAYDEQGEFIGRSVAVQTEVLLGADASRYRLRAEALLDVGGKQMPGEQQRLDLSLLTDRTETPLRVVRDDSTSISLRGQVVPCECWRVEVATEFGERHDTLYYSAETSPHLLKRVRTHTSDEVTLEESTDVVVHVDVPVLLAGVLQPGWRTLETTLHSDGAVTEKHRLHSTAAPGGMVNEQTIVRAPTGAVTRWSVTELVDWGLEERVSALSGGALGDGIELRVDIPPLRPRQMLRLLRRGEREEPGADETD